MRASLAHMLGAAATAGALAGVCLTGAGAMPAMASPSAGPGRAPRSPAVHLPAPFGRVWGSWAYDPAHRYVVLFGGDTGRDSGTPGVVLGTTWTWNGRWTEHHPASSPSSRTGAAIVYDAATRQLMLFGGSTGIEDGFQSDTWIWTGQTWTQLHPAASPPARHNADMTYDAATHTVILFGGYDGSYLGDTWSWNGVTWTQLHPAASPSPRDTDALVYDPATRTAILHDGFSSSTGHVSDTWSWNGTTWTQLHPAAFPSADNPVWQSAYDAATRQLIFYGPATWIWTGKTWTKLRAAARPGPRGYGAMTYDPALREALLFGGTIETTDPRGIWKWTGTAWQPNK